MPNRDDKFDEDTDDAIVLPRPVPEVIDNEDEDKRKADSAFDDMVIEVDDDEVKAESDNQPDGRKY
jgi:hypothetical protein